MLKSKKIAHSSMILEHLLLTSPKKTSRHHLDMVSSTKKVRCELFGVLQQPSWNHFFQDLTPKNRLALPCRYFSRIFSKVRPGSDILMLSKNLSNSPAARIVLLRLERNHHALASCHPMKKGFRSFKEHRKTSTSSAKFRLAVSNPKKNNPLRKRR